jgi:bisphosphoglycerate-independent phosphoglycerate mutase (AlkP superfamily)
LAEVVIREKLWKDFVAVTRQQRQKAETLAEQVLRDYVQRITDEELISRSARAARRAKFRMQETEEIVKNFRDSRKRT